MRTWPPQPLKQSRSTDARSACDTTSNNSSGSWDGKKYISKWEKGHKWHFYGTQKYQGNLFFYQKKLLR